jgi:hypothetical protein
MERDEHDTNWLSVNALAETVAAQADAVSASLVSFWRHPTVRDERNENELCEVVTGVKGMADAVDKLAGNGSFHTLRHLAPVLGRVLVSWEKLARVAEKTTMLAIRGRTDPQLRRLALVINEAFFAARRLEKRRQEGRALAGASRRTTRNRRVLDGVNDEDFRSLQYISRMIAVEKRGRELGG